MRVRPLLSIPVSCLALVLAVLGPGWSTAAAAATAPPNAPTALSVALDPSVPWHLRLTWTDNTPATDPSAETFIEVERCLGVGCTDWVDVFYGFTPGWDMVTFLDQDATKTDGTTYSYRVRGSNDAGASEWSNIATGTTGWRPPASPTDLTASYVGANTYGLDGDTRLTWTDNATTEFGYEVRRCDPMSCAASTVTTALPPNSTSYLDTTVVDGMEYWYVVVALGGSGLHGFSERVTHTAGVGLPAPTRASVSRVNAGLRLTWRNHVRKPIKIWRCDTNVCLDGATGRYLPNAPWVLKAQLNAGTSSWTDRFTPQAATRYSYRIQVVTPTAVSQPVFVSYLAG